jgi:hypothetical protein
MFQIKKNFMKKIGFTILIFFALILNLQSSEKNVSNSGISQAKVSQYTSDTFDKIINIANKEHWDTLPIGKIVAKVGMQFINTIYLGHTLEKEPERCVLDLEGLDCVTFFESSLDIARAIKLKETTIDEVIKQITFTRYRSGQLTDYTSRLHYTSDWFYDNIKKGVVEDITKMLGGTAINFNLYYMSKYYQRYNQLKNNPDFVKTIKSIEQDINYRTYYYIPREQIHNIESLLQDGDIVGLMINTNGLDYSHTGLICKEKDGLARFMHASFVKSKVVLDTTISEYVSRNSNIVGVTFVRPLKPTK